MHNAKTIESSLLSFLRERQGPDVVIEGDTDLIDSGLLDSLMVMDLICWVRTRFAVDLAPGEISPQNLRSVERFSSLVINKLATAKQAA